MLSFTEGSRLQMTSSGFSTWNELRYLLMSPATNCSWPVMVKLTFSCVSVGTTCLRRTCLKFKTMSATSSITPSMEANSWVTPSIWIEVMAKPSREDNKILLSALPMVMPKPGSRGRNSKTPLVSEPSTMITSNLIGFLKR